MKQAKDNKNIDQFSINLDTTMHNFYIKVSMSQVCKSTGDQVLYKSKYVTGTYPVLVSMSQVCTKYYVSFKN